MTLPCCKNKCPTTAFLSLCNLLNTYLRTRVPSVKGMIEPKPYFEASNSLEIQKLPTRLRPLLTLNINKRTNA